MTDDEPKAVTLRQRSGMKFLPEGVTSITIHPGTYEFWLDRGKDGEYGFFFLRVSDEPETDRRAHR